MRYLPLILSMFLLSALGFAQQRYLVSPNQEVIPLTKGQIASKIIAKRLNKSTVRTATGVTTTCPSPFEFGYTEDNFPPSSNFGGYHKDVLGQWYVAKATGTIDTIFWDALGVGALDSELIISIHQSNIGPTYGPGIRPGPFDPPCQNWGYWIDVTDNDQGIAAFPEDARPYNGTFQSTITNGTAGPPVGTSLWGPGGFPVVDHPNSINCVAMLDYGFPCSVSIGQVFFVAMKINSPNANVYPDTRTEWWTSGFQVTTADENYPSRDWKFYEHDSGPSNCSGLPIDEVKRGWVARGGFGADSTYVAMYNWWFTMTATSNTPPVVADIDIPHDMLATSESRVTVTADDCDPANPGLAGVASVSIHWVLDGVIQAPIAMYQVVGDEYLGVIPGEPSGHTINFFVLAVDLEGAVGNGPSHEYRTLDLLNTYYEVDTFSVCSHTSIAGTGTAISPSKFFDEVPTINPADDGQAGPYAIPGGPMTIFGDTARYVWVGVNGAIALSKTATDTLDINSGGVYTPTWTFPMAQRHGREDLVGQSQGLPPKNLIAPFFADLIYGDSMAQYGNIRYGNGGDPCQFVVEWDSIGTFDETTRAPMPDYTTFRVILNRCDGTIKYEYDNIGTQGQDSAALVGMQADSNHITAGYYGAMPGSVFINKDGYPGQTKPRVGMCVKFTPGAAYYATVGWNIVSVSTIPVGNNYNRTFDYPGSFSPPFRFHGGSYRHDVTTLENGVGYWLKYANPLYAGVPGTQFSSVFDTVVTGWNMIGVPSGPVPVPSGITPVNCNIISSFFGYNGSGYTIANMLYPGHGYWVRVTTTGPNAGLILTAPAALPKVEQAETDLAQMNQLIVRDSKGGNQTLYLGSESVLKSALSSYEMPPSMAELTGFDARFSSGRMVETYPSEMSNTTKYEYTIDIQSNAYPVTISLEGTKGTLAGMKMAARTQQGQLLGSLNGEGSSIKITNSSVKAVVLTMNDGANIPKVFALGQNYPNPFNPTTRFTVDVPKTSSVEVTIYDVLGQKVNTLMNGQQAPGSISVQWDGRDANGLRVTSGVYFVRMKTDNFTTTQKIVLMK